jgi:hypothetical protein
MVDRRDDKRNQSGRQTCRLALAGEQPSLGN